MKDYLQLLAAFAIILALIPCIGYGMERAEKKVQSAYTEAASGKVRILFEESGSVEAVSLREYIIGAVFAQMPADFEEEALKAQAVLASTYIKRRIAAENDDPTRSLNGAHISDDSEKYQAYFTAEQAKAVYGSEYKSAYEKISAAAEYAERLCLVYEDEPVMVAFHGISFGSTESAMTMWGEDIPYLRSVGSETDAELDECVNVYRFTEKEMLAALTGEFTDEDLGEGLADSISIAEKSENGTALKLRIGEGVYESARFCELLGLPSQHFSIEYSDGIFEISVYGCGHLVGMSQYGANEMAKQGKSCEEILLHYFMGASLVKE